MFAGYCGYFGSEVEDDGFACGVENLDGRFVFVQVDLVHGHALEKGGFSVEQVAGGFEACGFELIGDVFCCTFVGFGARVAAFHGVVRERDGLGPPCGGGGVGLLLRLDWRGERKKDYEYSVEGAGRAHGRRVSPEG